MPNIDDACTIQHQMGESYNNLNQLMSSYYEKIQAGEVIDGEQLLLGLGEIARSMLSTEKQFIATYAASDMAIQEIMFRQIANREEALYKAESELRGRGY